MSQEDQNRRIDYIEFPVLDIGEAKRFYGAVFDWSFTDYGPDYASFNDGRLSGGFHTSESVQPGGPLVIAYALDLEQVAEAVVAHGGTIVKETFDFPGGRRFHFRDPSGYELAVWSDKRP